MPWKQDPWSSLLLIVPSGRVTRFGNPLTFSTPSIDAQLLQRADIQVSPAASAASLGRHSHEERWIKRLLGYIQPRMNQLKAEAAAAGHLGDSTGFGMFCKVLDGFDEDPVEGRLKLGIEVGLGPSMKAGPVMRGHEESCMRGSSLKSNIP
ncbi:hypothetical protein N657DRAFT_71902 [Parathielavia appendiculata]|uniref:Uncharacterized protein n=1 Tax=Parathielavia appendiculata TaxID=2587402 RepID=A0AAN6UAU3_9PEZI|nr:hypothetical protein N657DRAFT_71902 [Parathielavia appendiculata]